MILHFFFKRANAITYREVVTRTYERSKSAEAELKRLSAETENEIKKIEKERRKTMIEISKIRNADSQTLAALVAKEKVIGFYLKLLFYLNNSLFELNRSQALTKKMKKSLFIKNMMIELLDQNYFFKHLNKIVVKYFFFKLSQSILS